MILGCLWIKKDEVLSNMINNSIIFFSGYYMHFGVFLSLIPLKLKRIEIILEVKYKNMVLKHILKKISEENLDDFLSII